MVFANTKTNTLMGGILRILCILLTVATIGLSHLSAQNNLSVSYSDINSVPSFLNVCGEPDAVKVTVAVSGGEIAARENILATLNLFEGVELIAFDETQSGAGVELTNNSNPAAPQFSLPDLSPNGTT